MDITANVSDFGLSLLALVALLQFALLAFALLYCLAFATRKPRQRPAFAALDRLHANLSEGNRRAAGARRAQEAGDNAACRAIIAGEPIPRRFARSIDG